MELQEVIERVQKNDPTLTRISLDNKDLVNNFNDVLTLIELLKTNTTVRLFDIGHRGQIFSTQIPLSVMKAIVELLKVNQKISSFDFYDVEFDKATAIALHEVLNNRSCRSEIYIREIGSAQIWIKLQRLVKEEVSYECLRKHRVIDITRNKAVEDCQKCGSLGGTMRRVYEPSSIQGASISQQIEQGINDNSNIEKNKKKEEKMKSNFIEVIERVKKNDPTLTRISLDNKDLVNNFNDVLTLIELLKTNTTVELFDIGHRVQVFSTQIPLRVMKAIVELLKVNQKISSFGFYDVELDEVTAIELYEVLGNRLCISEIDIREIGNRRIWDKTKESVKKAEKLKRENEVNQYKQSTKPRYIDWMPLLHTFKGEKTEVLYQLSNLLKLKYIRGIQYFDLCIGKTAFDDESAYYLSEVLKSNKVKGICLGRIQCGEKGIIYIAEALKVCWSLSGFRFDSTDVVGKNGGEALLKALEFNYTLVDLGLEKDQHRKENKSVPSEIRMRIQELLNRNKKIQECLLSAVENGDFDTIARLCFNANVLSITHGAVLLHAAIKNNHLEIVKFLIEYMMQRGIHLSFLSAYDENKKSTVDVMELANEIGNIKMIALINRLSSLYAIEQSLNFTLSSSATQVTLIPQQIEQGINNNSNSEKSEEKKEKTENSFINENKIMQSPIGELRLLESELNEEKKQREELQKQQTSLENQLFELKKQLHQQNNQQSSKTENLRNDISTLEEQLIELKQHDAILWNIHTEKEERKKAIEKFQPSPNALIYYRTWLIKLEELFVQVKSGNTPSGKLGKAADCIEVLGEFIELAPFGSIIEKCLKFLVATPLRHVDKKQQKNISERISFLATLSEVKKIVANVAYELTEHYLITLRNLSEETESLSWLKRKTYKAQARLPGQIIAEFSLLWIIESLHQGEIDPSQSIDKQLIRIAIAPPIQTKWRFTEFFRRVFKIQDINQVKVKTKNGEEITVMSICISGSVSVVPSLQGNNAVSNNNPVYTSPLSVKTNETTLKAFQLALPNAPLGKALQKTALFVQTNGINSLWISLVEENKLATELLNELNVILKRILGDRVLLFAEVIDNEVLTLQTKTPQQLIRLKNLLQESGLQVQILVKSPISTN